MARSVARLRPGHPALDNAPRVTYLVHVSQTNHSKRIKGTRAAAAYLGIDKKALALAVRRKELCAAVYGLHTWVFDVDELERFRRAHLIGGCARRAA